MRIRRLLSAAIATIGLAAVTVTFAPVASAATYPAGWSDYGSTTHTFDTLQYRVTTTIQLSRTASSSNPYDTVNAARTRCAIRRLGSTTGVQIDSCRMGIWNGPSLTGGGPFYGGATCCANGFSGFRYVDPVSGSSALLGRMDFSWRNGGVLRHDTTDAFLTPSSFALTTG